MSNLCPHWLSYHGYGIEEIRPWHTDWVKVVDPDPAQCALLKDELHVKLLARLFPMTVGDYSVSPLYVADEHTDMILANRCYGAVDVWETANEPGDLANPKAQAWLNEYWQRMIVSADNHGHRLCWGNFANGTPPGENNQGGSDWLPYKETLQRAGTRHILGLHEYWGVGEFFSYSPWWVNRYAFVPGEPRIMITECGFNSAVGGGLREEGGWRFELTEETYLNQLRGYLNEIRKDYRVLAAFVFTLDFSSPRWQSFDVHGLGTRIGALNAVAAPVPAPTPSPAHDLLIDLRQQVIDAQDLLSLADDKLDSLYQKLSSIL